MCNVQVPLQPVGDRDVAAQLVEGYMGLFEKAISEETLGSRLLSTLLSGLDRAFPALGGDVAPVVKHVDALFRIVHSEAFTTSVRALVLISRIALTDTDNGAAHGNSKGKKRNGSNGKGQPAAAADDGEQGITTRFYRALYAKLLSPQVSTRAYNTLFLNLLYRSMKRDPSTRRVMAFVKRLGLCALQVRGCSRLDVPGRIAFQAHQPAVTANMLLCTLVAELPARRRRPPLPHGRGVPRAARAARRHARHGRSPRRRRVQDRAAS